MDAFRIEKWTNNLQLKWFSSFFYTVCNKTIVFVVLRRGIYFFPVVVFFPTGARKLDRRNNVTRTFFFFLGQEIKKSTSHTHAEEAWECWPSCYRVWLTDWDRDVEIKKVWRVMLSLMQFVFRGPAKKNLAAVFLGALFIAAFLGWREAIESTSCFWPGYLPVTYSPIEPRGCWVYRMSACPRCRTELGSRVRLLFFLRYIALGGVKSAIEEWKETWKKVVGVLASAYMWSCAV